MSAALWLWWKGIAFPALGIRHRCRVRAWGRARLSISLPRSPDMKLRGAQFKFAVADQTIHLLPSSGLFYHAGTQRRIQIDQVAIDAVLPKESVNKM